MLISSRFALFGLGLAGSCLASAVLAGPVPQKTTGQALQPAAETASSKAEDRHHEGHVTAPPEEDAQDLHGIMVEAEPIEHVTPRVTLDGLRLEINMSGTLGRTVSKVPGVHTTGMGQAV